MERVVDVARCGGFTVCTANWRLDQNRARVCVVVAGMEGALPSVVAGLGGQTVIAVPTSVGYGANFGGLSALFGAMLYSCAHGIGVGQYRQWLWRRLSGRDDQQALIFGAWADTGATPGRPAP
jgi:NCAIR mutase (PurE)-related protein